MDTDIPRVMRASVLVARRQVRTEERPVPVPAADEVLIKVVSVGVCGSDVHYYREGRIGDFVIVATGAEVPGQPDRRAGRDRAAAPVPGLRAMRGRPLQPLPPHGVLRHPPVDGAFREYVTIQSPFAHRVPDSVPDDLAGLLEPLSVGIWASRKAGIVPGSRVLIAGAGPIGLRALYSIQAGTCSFGTPEHTAYSRPDSSAMAAIRAALSGSQALGRR